MYTMELIGQFLIGFCFAFMAIYNLKNKHHLESSLKAKKWNIPMWAIQVTTVLELIGGIFVILGFAIDLAVLYLIAFTVVVSFLLHPFWKFSGHDRWKHMAIVMQNLAVIGGLLLVM